MYRNHVIFLLSLFCTFVSQAQSTIDCDEESVPLVIDLVVDNYPEEMQWYVHYENGDTLYSFDYSTEILDDVIVYDINGDTLYVADDLVPADMDDGERLIHAFCVPKDTCLVFSMRDIHGDGICCERKEGSYHVYYGDTLIAQGGKYAYMENTFMGCGEGSYCNQASTAYVDEIYTTTQDDHWYVFYPDSSGQYLINTCNNDCNTSIWLYDKCFGVNITESVVGTLTYTTEGCDSTNQASLLVNLTDTIPFYIRIGDDADDCTTDNIEWSITYMGPPIGCTDPTACNFDSFAEEMDEGSCIYPGSPDCPAGPDLAVPVSTIRNTLRVETVHNLEEQNCLIEERCIAGYGTRQLLRFSTEIRNIGDMDYFLGQPPPDEDEESDQWEWDPCHDHWHFEGYAEYLLFDWEDNPLPVGFKNGFCVLDLGCFTENTPKYTCGLQGISAGCYDRYEDTFECQWIDITDIPDDTYKLVVRVNWDQSPDATGRVESSYDNNFAQVCFVLNRDGSGPLLTLVPTGSCNNNNYVDCAGTVQGNSVVDCSGECGGAAAIGDYNGSLVIDSLDLPAYETGLIVGDEATPCTDLNGDNVLSVTDIVLMNECLIDGGDMDIVNGKCAFPYGITNINDTVAFSVDTIAWLDRYVDFNIHSPDNGILGFQLGIEGVKIDSLALLFEGAEDYQIETDHNFSLLYGYAVDGVPIPKISDPEPFLRVYFQEEAVADSLCFDCFHTVVNEQREEVIINTIDACHDLTEHIDCNGTIGGTLIVDCDGICGGTGVLGDFNLDSLRDTEDVEDYLFSLLSENPDRLCNDFNSDSLNSLADVVLLSDCLAADEGCEVLPFEASEDTVIWSIGGLNDSLAYFELSLENPNAEIRAFQLEFSGFSIDGIESITLDNADFSFLYNDSILIVLANEESLMEESMNTPVFRIFIDEDTASTNTICLEQSIEVVSKDGEIVHALIGNSCLDISAFLDCADMFNGSLKIDCAGECGGTAIFADINADEMVNEADVTSYLNNILAGEMNANGCNDFNGDGAFELADAVMFNTCLMTNEDLETCDFSDITDNDDAITHWEIKNLNPDELYFEIHFYNPNSNTQAFQLDLNGVVIDSIETIQNETSFDLQLAYNETSLIVLANQLIAPQVMSFPLLRVHFNENTLTEEICLTDIVSVIDGNGAKITQTFIEGSCIAISDYQDCAGVFNGTSVIDCNDECGGTGIIGDINQDLVVDEADLNAYLEAAFEIVDTILPCFDLNNDQLLGLEDALIANACINNDSLCSGVSITNNENETVSFSVKELNEEEKFFTLQVSNPNSTLLGTHLRFSGMDIIDIVPVESDIEVELEWRHSENELIVLSKYLEPIPNNEEFQTLLWIHFEAFEASEICIEEIVSVLNSNFEKINGAIEGTCLNIESLYDCAGVFGGTATVDCNGVCEGIALSGDINGDLAVNENDFDIYLQNILSNSMNEQPCYDLNNDANVGLEDALLVHTCVNNEMLCEGITTSFNENQTASFSIDELNIEEQYFRLKVSHPNSNILGAHLRFEGLIIEHLELSPNVSDEGEIEFIHSDEEVVFWSNNSMGLLQTDAIYACITVYFEVEESTEVCLAEVLSVVNNDFERINGDIEGNCIALGDYVDCAGVVNGTAVMDCNGICDGTAVQGDINDDLAVNEADLALYLDNLLTNSNGSIAPCQDLTTDGLLTLNDVLMLNACLLGSSICGQTIEDNNNEAATYFFIEDLNPDERHFTLKVINPNTNLMGVHLSIEGIDINSIIVDEAYQNNESLSLGSEHTTSDIILWSQNLEVLPQSGEKVSLAKVYFEIPTTEEICISEIKSAINHQFEFVNGLANDACISLTPYYDCNGDFNGGEVLDCEGVCGGFSLTGDYNNDYLTGISDVYHYIFDIINDSWNVSSCNDLNADGLINIFDPVLLNACLMNEEGNQCNFPYEVTASEETLSLSIQDINLEENYIDVYLHNPTSAITGFQFKVEGIVVSQVQVLDPSFGSIDLFLNHNDDTVIGLVTNATPIPEQETPLFFVRLYYDTLNDNTICLDEPIFVDENRQSVNANVEGTTCEEINTDLEVIYDAENISVYPNPFVESTHIYLPNITKAFTLKLYNVQGQLVREVENIQTAVYELKRENLTTGAYFFELVGEQERHSGKLIIR